MSHPIPQPRVLRFTLSREAAGTVAGLVAGAAYLAAQVLLTVLTGGGSAIDPLARIAAILMGPGIAPPGAHFSFTVLGMASIIHAGLSIVFGQIVSVFVWRRTVPVAIALGAAIGVALFGLDFELIAPSAFPWFASSVHSISLLDHVLFGVVAAAVCLALRGTAADAAGAH